MTLKFTPIQIVSLYNIFNRCPLTLVNEMPRNAEAYTVNYPLMTFGQFVDFAQTTIGDFISVPWCGMYLAIEQDGHVHS